MRNRERRLLFGGGLLAITATLIVVLYRPVSNHEMIARFERAVDDENQIVRRSPDIPIREDEMPSLPVAQFLRENGRRAVPALLQELATRSHGTAAGDADYTLRALQALGTLQDSRAISAVDRLRNDSTVTPAVRLQAIDTRLRLAGADTAAVLIKGLKDATSTAERRWFVGAIADYGVRAAIPFLEEVRSRESNVVLRALIDAMLKAFAAPEGCALLLSNPLTGFVSCSYFCIAQPHSRVEDHPRECPPSPRK